MTDTPIAERSHSLNDPRYMFAGPQAETSDLLLFNRAREMEKKRLSTYTIFQQTGWLRGVDGKWRFEISDHDAKLKIGIPNEVMDDVMNRVYFEAEFTTEPSGLIKASYRKDTPEYLAAFGSTREEAADSLIKHLAKREYNGIRDIQQVIGQPLRLDELLHHPTLFAAYPNLREATILFDLSLPDTVGGEFSWTDGIRLNPNVDQSKILSTIIHEIQHAIQEAEGFAYGGQPEERFTSSIKRHLKNLSDDMQEKVTYWTDANWDLLDEERATADMLTYGMMYQSMRRLREYANRDKPSGVLRLIRNEMGWWHHDKVRNSEHQRRADELERNWYNLPKRHKMQARNRFLREQCAEAADILSDLIPTSIQKQFREDERQLKSILRSLDRAAEKARQALQPLRELKSQSKVAETLKERHHYHSPFKIYQSLAGEIEARNAEARMLLTPEERRETHPEKTADVSQDDAIVIFRNGRGFDVEVPFRTASAAEAIQAETPANDRARELVTQYPGQSDAELEAAFEAATSEGDDVLLALILRYRSEKTARDKAGELFSGFADFYTDSDNPLLAAIAEATVRQRDGQDIRATLLERQQGDLTGIQMTNSTGTQGAVFLPDASEPGRVRATFFDQQGFYGHITRDSYEAALEEAWRSGFNRETNRLLETWMNLDSFREGNEVASLIAQVNRGEISHQEYLEKAQAIQEERDRANAVVVLRNGNQQSVTVAYRPDTLTPNDYLIPFTRTDKALTKEQAQYISDSLMLDWKDRPEITVVNRVSELPSALQRDIWKNDAASDVRAAFWKNTVFVIAPRIADRNTLEQVLLHEIVGHYGLRTLLGEHLEPTLERIYQDMGRDPIADQIKTLYFGNPPFDAGNPAHRQLVAEEMMAKLAESGEYRALSEWERFEAQSRNGLRQMGFQLPLNKSDLLNILHGAEQVVRHGGLSRQSDNDWTGDASTSTPRPMTDTPAFLQWFGNSKVVGENGEPLVAYHGTDAEFNVFKPSKTGTYGPGIYFANEENYASECYGSRVVKAYISLQNPWEVSADPDSDAAFSEDHDHPSITEILELPNGRNLLDAAKHAGSEHFGAELTSELISLGYDGVIATYKDGSKEYVAFHPEQIKSAVNNIGTFDATNPDIRYKRAYHGTPHAFDRFSLEAVGSGEGAQAYGWGLYFASNKKLAEWYRDTLTPAPVTNIISGWDTTGASDTAKGLLRDLPISKAIEYAKARQGKLRGLYDGVDKELAEIESKGKSQVVEGYVYQVDIPEDHQFLIWEKPLTDQSGEVIHAIKESGILEKTGNEPWPVSGHMMDGNDLYEAVRQWFVNEDAAWGEIGKTPYDVTNVSQAASEYLNQIGIPGLRYLDAQSRNPDVAPDEADYNYVVWDENAVTIEAVNEEVRQAETEARLSRAYHGSPFTFTRFDSQFIGAGEGNQAYGHGLYFAGRQAVAEHYQRNTLPDYWQFSPDNQAWDASGASETARHLLATLPIDKAIAAASVLADQIHSEYAEAAKELREIRNRGPIDDSGNLYEVEIPDDHHLMDWDASLKDQPPAIVDALLNIEDTYLQEVLSTDPVPSPDGDYWSFMGETYATAEDALNDHTPEDLIRGRRGRLGDSPKAISDTLNKAGIPGLRYLDAQSRFGTLDSHDLPPEQSHNYVIWDDQAIDLTTSNPESIRLYHATTKEFDRFNTTHDLGYHLGTKETAQSRLDDLVELYEQPKERGRIIAADVVIQNPLRLRDAGSWQPEGIAYELENAGLIKESEIPDWAALSYKEIRKRIQDYGYDGIVYDNTMEGGGDSYIAFEADQIKIRGTHGQTALPELPTVYKENLIRYSRTPSPQIESTLPPVRSADDLFRASVSEAKAELAERENQIMAAYEAGHYTKAEVLDAELSELYDELEHRLADLEINGGTLSSKQPVAKDSPLYRILALGQSDDPDSEADLLGILANAYNDYIDPNHWVDRDSTITNARANIENLGGNTDDVSDDAIIDMLKDAYDHYGKQRTADRKGTLPTFKNRITEHSAIEWHPEQAEVLLDKLDDEHLRMLLFEEAGIRASDLNQDNLIRLAMEHRLYEVENKFYNELIRTTINRFEAGTDSPQEAANNLNNIMNKGAFGYDKAAVEGILDKARQETQSIKETEKRLEPATLSPEDKQKQFLYMEIRYYEERLLEAEARRSENEIAAKKEARHCAQTLDQLQTELSMLQAGMTVKEIDQQTSPAVRPASPEYKKPNAMPNGANLKKVLQMSAFQKRKLAEQKSELQEAAPEKKEEPGDGLHP